MALHSIDRGQPVHVVWRDSAQYMLEWMSVENASALELATVETVGILVVLNHELLILALDRDAHGHMKNFTVIPRSCIVSADLMLIARRENVAECDDVFQWCGDGEIAFA